MIHFCLAHISHSFRASLQRTPTHTKRALISTRCGLACLTASLIASCETNSQPQPPPAESSQAIGNSADHPLGTGSVEFVNFDPAALQRILVIPEEGGSMFTPTANTRIDHVDGFWLEGNRLWFKIPDHCHTTITWTPNGLLSSPTCSALGIRVQKLRGGLVEPRWVMDAGSTSHPTDYPF